VRKRFALRLTILTRGCNVRDVARLQYRRHDQVITIARGSFVLFDFNCEMLPMFDLSRSRTANLITMEKDGLLLHR
jgi:hypothetical protein